MNKKYIVIALLLISVGILIVALSYYRSIEKNVSKQEVEYSLLPGQEPGVTIRPKMTGRGQDVSTNDTILYQFPVTILSEPNTDIGAYSVNIFAFDDENEFTLLLGPEDGSLMFGTCSFTENGEITSEARWSVIPLSDILEEIGPGTEVLVRIGYPRNDITIDQRYKDEMQFNIDALRNNEPIQIAVPISLCISE